MTGDETDIFPDFVKVRLAWLDVGLQVHSRLLHCGRDGVCLARPQQSAPQGWPTPLAHLPAAQLPPSLHSFSADGVGLQRARQARAAPLGAAVSGPASLLLLLPLLCCHTVLALPLLLSCRRRCLLVLPLIPEAPSSHH